MDEMIVVGAGVIGLTTAVVLAERGVPVRVWARETETAPRSGVPVSSVAGGLVWPYRIEPVEQALDWSIRSFRTFSWLSERYVETGVRLMPGTMDDGTTPPARWTELVGDPPRTALVDMGHYLGYLTGRLTAAGGTLERHALHSLREAGQRAPVVVNCSGLGARELVPDPTVRPVRGQLLVVENPGLDRWYVSADPVSALTTYMFPQPYGLVLGGTAEEDQEFAGPDPAVSRRILERCVEVEPRLAGARVLDERVGLRPSRPSVRLECERLPDGALCLHQYGHGGAGVTVSWGSARDALALLEAEGVL
ncbi:FAD-dependent oxidoreductase [Streptomyces sp. NPDC005438]|uniref:FAD-dependent oxidoreductase n=1 Tax=Streptomyces sp. NPDC005438 TaxID=3156880 RepID=UPI0033A61239